MSFFYARSIAEFVVASGTEISGLLSLRYAQSGFSQQRTTQTLTWANDISLLQVALAQLIAAEPNAAKWIIVLEFEIPRKNKRVDVVLLAEGQIAILELKSGTAGSEAFRQAEEYALLLHYFHRPSWGIRITPVVVSGTDDSLRADQLFMPLVEAPAYWIPPVKAVSWERLPRFLTALRSSSVASVINAADWLNGAYHPVPTIIDAARELEAGLNTIREVAHSQAAHHDVDDLTAFVQAVVKRSKAESKHSICFLTGVPGSGKTLVGLNLALAASDREEPIHFMSGNAPLVKVLQTVLARAHSSRMNVKAETARLHAKTLIENVHLFATEYFERDTSRPPSNRVVVFDEAQRAWNEEQNRRKFKRTASEPEMLLSIMERHADWSVVIALVGGGQEINSGEAGLSEWGRALLVAHRRPWNIYASPEALHGGPSVAGVPLFPEVQPTGNLLSEPRLHLDVSIRNLRAENFARWVNHVLHGEAEEAQLLTGEASFPIYLSRDLRETRQLLNENALGDSRSGLVGSSKAARLRAEGLEPDSTFHGDYPWEHWYLASQNDVRSSYQHEVFATEFEIQGLELDWIGVCWGGDLIWSEHAAHWIPREFRSATSKWREMTRVDQRLYRINAYRVLLTRARQGVVIFVPKGDASDPTRVPSEFQAAAEFLVRCGAKPAALARRRSS